MPLSTETLETLANAERGGLQRACERLGINYNTARRELGVYKRDLAMSGVEIDGVTTEAYTDIEDIWTFAEAYANRALQQQQAKAQQVIRLPNEPVAIAFLSDLHIGSVGTDYAAIRRDADIISTTPGMFVGAHGDMLNNYIIGKLQALQRGELLSLDWAYQLFNDWLDRIAHKLLWWVEGNHDLWTEKLAGVNPTLATLSHIRLLYDRHQCVFQLNHCGVSRTVIVRHKWRGYSKFNATHGIETGWNDLDIDFDWGIAGHTHQGTYCRPFHKHNKMRYAILTGTYKRKDEYGLELGLSSPKGSGSGAMVLDTNGEQVWFDQLESAANYLTWLRER